MNSELLRYFDSLESLKNKDGQIHTDSVDIELLSPRSREHKVPMYTLNGQPVYIKDGNDRNTIVGLATSQMYNDIGLTTPTQYILTTAPSNRKLFTRVRNHDPRFTDTSIVTADISSIPGIESDTIDSILSREDKDSAPFRIGRYAWQFLYDSSVRAILMKYMTPEAYNDMVADSLISEVRTDIDRHFLNAFLYKKSGAKKYEGLIPIDLDNLEILKHIYIDKFTKDNFEEFLTSTYESTSLTGKHCNRAYYYRMADLKEIIDDGVVPLSSLEKLRSALSYDLPGVIEEQCKIGGFSRHKKPIISAYNRLWDFNRTELRDHLGL